MGAQHTPATLRIQARLERLELEHLRTLVAEQAEEIAHLNRQLETADYAADFWSRSHHDLVEQMADDTEGGRCIGLTPAGEMLVMRTGVAA